MSCEVCIRWRRLPSTPRARYRVFGACAAPLAGPAPYFRVKFGVHVLTYAKHGEGCAAFKEKKRR